MPFMSALTFLNGVLATLLSINRCRDSGIIRLDWLLWLGKVEFHAVRDGVVGGGRSVLVGVIEEEEALREVSE